MKTQTLKSGKREWVCDPPLSEHTTGPWEVQGPSATQLRIRAALHFNVCKVLRLGSLTETKANARLIAAAPDLLLVAECITRGLTNGQKERGETLELLAHRAISKAKGQL